MESLRENNCQRYYINNLLIFAILKETDRSGDLAIEHQPSTIDSWPRWRESWSLERVHTDTGKLLQRRLLSPWLPGNKSELITDKRQLLTIDVWGENKSTRTLLHCTVLLKCNSNRGTRVS